MLHVGGALRAGRAGRAGIPGAGGWATGDGVEAHRCYRTCGKPPHFSRSGAGARGSVADLRA